MVKSKTIGLEEQVKEYSFPSWIWIIFGGAVTLMVLTLGIFSAGIIVVVLFITKPYFTRWALEIGKSPVVPFFWVLGLGLFGYLIYWIYYNFKVGKAEK